MRRLSNIGVHFSIVRRSRVDVSDCRRTRCAELEIEEPVGALLGRVVGRTTAFIAQNACH
jgi:hypothetical protein